MTMEEKFHIIIYIMALDKVLGSNSIALQFSLKYWEVLGSNYAQMDATFLCRGSFPKYVIRKFITLILKGDNKDLLVN